MTKKHSNVEKNLKMTKNKEKNKPQNRKKSLSRLIAIQSLYQHEFNNHQGNLNNIIQNLIENYTLDEEKSLISYRKKIDDSFLNSLIGSFELDREKTDNEISVFLKGDWTIDKIDILAKQVLRLGTVELKYFTEIPTKVILDEYVDIAASFFDNKKLSFINATLDSLAKVIRQN